MLPGGHPPVRSSYWILLTVCSITSGTYLHVLLLRRSAYGTNSLIAMLIANLQSPDTVTFRHFYSFFYLKPLLPPRLANTSFNVT